MPIVLFLVSKEIYGKKWRDNGLILFRKGYTEHTTLDTGIH